MNLQKEYDKINFYFRKTTENFDLLDWNGKNLNVFFKDKIIEKYSKKDLMSLEIL